MYGTRKLHDVLYDQGSVYDCVGVVPLGATPAWGLEPNFPRKMCYPSCVSIHAHAHSATTKFAKQNVVAVRSHTRLEGVRLPGPHEAIQHTTYEATCQSYSCPVTRYRYALLLKSKGQASSACWRQQTKAKEAYGMHSKSTLWTER